MEVTMLGNQAPVGIELTEEALALERKELESRIAEAMKDAHAKCAPAAVTACSAEL